MSLFTCCCIHQNTIWPLTDCHRNLTLAPAGFTPTKTMAWPITFLGCKPLPSHPVTSLFIHLSSCLCLMGYPCFGSIADFVQSHGGVFMDSSYPSSPVTGPHCRGLRRASEVSVASQVSGMADSYTATNIANSKCSPYHKYLSLSHSHCSISINSSFSQSLL